MFAWSPSRGWYEVFDGKSGSSTQQRCGNAGHTDPISVHIDEAGSSPASSPAQPADLSAVQQQVAQSLAEMSLDDHEEMLQDPHSFDTDERIKMLNSVRQADHDFGIHYQIWAPATLLSRFYAFSKSFTTKPLRT